MPSINVYKNFVKNGVYHAYNRGVEKRKIFLDDQDYRVFLHLLKYYLSPTDKQAVNPVITTGNTKLIRPRPLKNLKNEVNLIAYCLMPNHFHLLLMQKTIDGMTKLLRRVCTTYAMYFNRRYNRVGYLFQGRYKAAKVDDDAGLLYISRYIHLNPGDSKMTGYDPVSYPYSSFTYFLGKKFAKWLHPQLVIKLVDKNKSYQDFVETDLDSPDKKTALLNLDKTAR